MEALKKVKIPVLRWPGGCFADEYHWMDGIGPKNKRPTMINTHWGGVTEDNSFGTHEFMELCDMLGCEPYICGNVGSGTVQEMSQWVEYMTFDGVSPMSKLREKNGRKDAWKLKYFGVGNENWGCGGTMRPEYYADLYRRYQTYCRNYGENKLYKIACGPGSGDYNWTEVMMQNTSRRRHNNILYIMDGLSLHHYTTPSEDWINKGPATGFEPDQWFTTLYNTLYMEELITRHSTIMDKYDPDKNVALIVDEWGTWYDVEPGTNPGFLYQQNSLRDALVAALNFHIFHNHNDRVKMTNIAQTVNVLQALILTEGEKMITTPTYHVFEMFTPHQDAQLLSTSYDSGTYSMEEKQAPHISVSASKKEGKVFVSIVNLSHENDAKIELDLRGENLEFKSGRIISSGTLDAHNTFENPDALTPSDFSGVRYDGSKFIAIIPAASVTVLNFE